MIPMKDFINLIDKDNESNVEQDEYLKFIEEKSLNS